MENYKNNQNEQVEDEIPNMEQFQVSRSSLEEKGLEDDHAATGDGGYTTEEVKFADGEGTLLDEETPDEEDDFDDDEEDLEEDDDFEDADLSDED